MLSELDFHTLVRNLAPQIAREPRPVATLRIGAIGHRRIDPADVDTLAATIESIFSTIRRESLLAVHQNAIGAEFAGGPDLVLISPLAEGADSLVARLASAQDYLLAAILPFSIQAYEATFDLGDETKVITEFRELLDKAALPNGFGIEVLDGSSQADRREEAFLNCGQAVTRASDILIAILGHDRWASHTGFIARGAIDAGLPVIVIDPASPAASLWIDELQCNAEDFGSCLPRLVRSLLLPGGPNRGAKQGVGHSAVAGIARYCEERVTYDPGAGCNFEHSGPYRAKTVAPIWLVWCAGLNRLVEDFFGFPRTNSVAPHSEQVQSSPITSLHFSRETALPFVDLYLRYHRADVLANKYAELYRSAHILISMFAALTIVFAAINPPGVISRSFTAATELFFLLLALSLVWEAHRQKWLDRWLDYRLLAEVCRYSKFLLLAGRSSPFGDLGGGFSDAAGERNWVRNHAMFLLRAHRLAVPGRGRNCREGSVEAIRDYIVRWCVSEQIHYHRTTGPARRRLAVWLRRFTLAVSLVTIATVLLKFGLSFWIAASPLLDVLAVILPVVTAAALAFRAFAEHEILAKRSAAMAQSLTAERNRIEKSTDLRSLGGNMLRVARLLLREVDGWLDISADKRLE